MFNALDKQIITPTVDVQRMVTFRTINNYYRITTIALYKAPDYSRSILLVSAQWYSPRVWVERPLIRHVANAGPRFL